MNETGADAPVMTDTVGLFTAAHLAIIVILIVLAIIVIWWGSRLRARNRPRDVESPVTTERTATPAPAAPPVAPPPPPLADDVGIPVAPAPAPTDAVPVAPPSADAGGAAQPVTMLKGLGPKVAARLGELGIATVGQIAALSPAEAEALDADLGTFSGRMARDRWIEQATLLATGDTAAYEATFGKIG